MKQSVASMAKAVISILCLLGFFVVPASAEEYAALKGVQAVKTIFDFRDGDTESALIHLKLVHDTYKSLRQWLKTAFDLKCACSPLNFME